MTSMSCWSSSTSVTSHSSLTAWARVRSSGTSHGRAPRAWLAWSWSERWTPHFGGVVGEATVEAVIEDLHADRPAWFRNGTDAYFARPGSGVSQAIADDGVASILMTPLEVQTACMRAFALTDLTTQLAGIDVPVLVIHGDVDASAPLEITGRPTAALIRAPASRCTRAARTGST